MATVYRCDRCKTEQSFKIEPLMQVNGGGYFAELCKSCLEDFRTWVKAGTR